MPHRAENTIDITRRRRGDAKQPRRCKNDTCLWHKECHHPLGHFFSMDDIPRGYARCLRQQQPLRRLVNIPSRHLFATNSPEDRQRPARASFPANTPDPRKTVSRNSPPCRQRHAPARNKLYRSFKVPQPQLRPQYNDQHRVRQQQQTVPIARVSMQNEGRPTRKTKQFKSRVYQENKGSSRHEYPSFPRPTSITPETGAPKTQQGGRGSVSGGLLTRSQARVSVPGSRLLNLRPSHNRSQAVASQTQADASRSPTVAKLTVRNRISPLAAAAFPSAGNSSIPPSSWLAQADARLCSKQMTAASFISEQAEGKINALAPRCTGCFGQ